MASFPCLEGLAVAANSRVNEHRLLIAELNVFGGPLALQCAEFLTQLSQTKVLRMLEIRKSIAEVHMMVDLSGKVVQYNLISKTLHEIYDCGSNQVDDNDDANDDDDDDELFQQFQAEHNVYEFIPSLCNVCLKLLLD
ncbi:hypothetical protein Tco_0901547 [Tanacetum coccineum]